MSNSPRHRPSDLDLMMFFDGELSGEDARRVEIFLQENSHAAAKVTALGQMSELIRGTVEIATDDVDDALSGLWGRIDGKIRSSSVADNRVTFPAETSAPMSLHPVTLLEETAASVQPVEVGQGEGGDRWMPGTGSTSGWFAGWPGHLICGVAAAVAVAALMIVFRPVSPGDGGDRFRLEPQAARGQLAQKAMSEEEVPAATIVASLQEPEVEELEVYGGSGTIMMVAADGSEGASAVIWISDYNDVVKEPI